MSTCASMRGGAKWEFSPLLGAFTLFPGQNNGIKSSVFAPNLAMALGLSPPPLPAAAAAATNLPCTLPLLSPSLLIPCCRLTLDEKFALCRSVGEECIQEEELRRMLEKKPHIVAYDGFEPSGRMHIAQVSGMTWVSCPGYLPCWIAVGPLHAWNRGMSPG